MKKTFLTNRQDEGSEQLGGFPALTATTHCQEEITEDCEEDGKEN